MGIALTVGIAALAGIIVALTLPRGPSTQVQALVMLCSGLLIGLLSGLSMRSGWAMLIAPLVHVVAFEIARPHLLGPTVGTLRLNELSGVLAFALGRGLYGLVALVPMVIGAYLGAVFANQLFGVTPPTGNLILRWSPALLSSLTVIALAIWIAFPASTPAILGANRQPVPGSIAALTTVRLRGKDQSIMIRGFSSRNPVLLYLNGGPGQSGLPFTRVILNDLSKDFVVVDWDQRGTGKSYAAFEPASTFTLDGAINDTIELAAYLTRRFNQPKIYLVGESWGSILGVLAVQRRPDLFHAFIGSGQMVSPKETDQRIYKDVLSLAARNGDTRLAARMRSFGQPPYADIPYANLFVMGQYGALYKPYTPSQAYQDLGNAAGIGPYGLLAREYNLIEKFNVMRGLMDSFTVLYPQLQGIDFRRDVKRLEVPIFILDGEAELSARRRLMLEWFAELEAPKKQIFALPNAAHAVAFEQFETFGKIMRETVVTNSRP